jgi:hypothetical protein
MATETCSITAIKTNDQRYFCCACLKVEIRNKKYRTINLSVVLYGYETWSLTSRKEHRVRLFENKVVRKTFGYNRK